jgi:hypothetical protein
MKNTTRREFWGNPDLQMNLMVKGGFGGGACGKVESGQDYDPPSAVEYGYRGKKELRENIRCCNPGRCSFYEWHGGTSIRFHHNIHLGVGWYWSNIERNLGLITGIQ